MKKISLLCLALTIVIFMSAWSETTDASAVKTIDEQNLTSEEESVDSDRNEVVLSGNLVDLDEDSCRLLSVNHDILSLENQSDVNMLESLMEDIEPR